MLKTVPEKWLTIWQLLFNGAELKPRPTPRVSVKKKERKKKKKKKRKIQSCPYHSKFEYYQLCTARKKNKNKKREREREKGGGSLQSGYSTCEQVQVESHSLSGNGGWEPILPEGSEEWWVTECLKQHIGALQRVWKGKYHRTERKHKPVAFNRDQLKALH